MASLERLVVTNGVGAVPAIQMTFFCHNGVVYSDFVSTCPVDCLLLTQ